MHSNSSDSLDHFDLFVCHASEDKADVARPLARELRGRGLRVWLDELELTVGDSLNERIEWALARTRFGVVILSPAFFAKRWPQRELAGLAAKEIDGGVKVILPVWHDVDYHYIVERAPVLADRLGALTVDGLPKVADMISLALERSGGPMSKGVSVNAPGSDRKARKKRRSSTRLLALASVAALAVGALGFAIVPPVKSERAHEALTGGRSRSVHLEAPSPVGWQSVPQAEVDSVRLRDSVSAGAASSSARLDLGFAPTSSPTLLPAPLTALLTTGQRGETVRLGDLYFYRYRNLNRTSGQQPLTAYTTASTDGALVGLCSLSTAKAASEANCERILAATQLHGVDPLALGPQRGYASAVRAVVNRLGKARDTWEPMLLRARRAATQSASARQLAAAYDRAAGGLTAAPTGPAERSTNAAIVASLRAVASGYAAMSKATKSGDTSRFARARSRVTAGSGEFRDAVARLSTFGYRGG